MSYDEYLEYFERVRKARAASSGGGAQSNGLTPPLPATQTVRSQLLDRNTCRHTACGYCNATSALALMLLPLVEYWDL